MDRAAFRCSRNASWTCLCLALATLLASACGPIVIDPVAAYIPATQPAAFDYTDYALALRRAVRPDGVDYAALLADPAPLDRFLARASRLGPASTPALFPSADDRLAYLINAHNAAVLRAVMAWCRNGRVPEAFWIDPAGACRFTIDGLPRTAASLGAEARAAGDWRVAFALCAGRRGDPPLADRPYLPGVLDAQLNAQVVQSLEHPRIVTIDHGFQRLLLGRVLFERQSELVRDYERRTRARDAGILNVLLELSPRERFVVLNSAIGYEVRPLPFDTRLNRTPPPPRAPAR